ncbi:MAG TPA: hypothetical protein PLE30_08205 [Candidatus Kapabacteria bacterium]|nr:hypothetical protein [Candidatus Kapabacteria bacterium]
MLRILLIYILLFVGIINVAFSQDYDNEIDDKQDIEFISKDIFKKTKLIPYEVYVVRLNNGDILSGKVLELDRDKNNKLYIKLANILGNPIIYEDDIIEIYPEASKNRHRHRHFIMPSAFEIGNDHFISNYMLGFFYAGFGISDFISITAGRTFIPIIEAQYQATLANIKFTIIDEKWDSMKGGLKVSLGGNLAFLNNKNNLNHIYTNFTFYGEKTDITGLIFAKTGNEDIYDFRLNDNLYNFIYEDGAFGLGLGITTKISTNHNLFFVGELWNTNITKRTNTALLGAIRLTNTSFSADFGFVFMTVPYFFPIINFAWTPF